MTKPKISINKLGEYLDASPSRRKRIVQDQKDPKAFIVARYSDAREEIVKFLSTGLIDEESLLRAAQTLRTTEASTEFIQQDKQASADAIEDFLEASDGLDLEGIKIEAVDKSISSSMEISGIDVSIRPDAILRDTETNQICGAIKLHFPKTNPLSDKSAEYVATAVRVYLAENYTSSPVDPSKCFVVDVPTKKVTVAPKAYKNKMRDITAACEEIDARWNKENH